MNSSVMTVPRMTSGRSASPPVISFENGHGVWKKPEARTKFKIPDKANKQEALSNVFQSLALGEYLLEKRPDRNMFFTVLTDAFCRTFASDGCEIGRSLLYPIESTFEKIIGQVSVVDGLRNACDYAVVRRVEDATCVIEIEQQTLPSNEKYDFGFARRVLDEDSIERLERFSSLTTGWYLGSGKSLQDDSLIGFKNFVLAAAQILNLTNSSVFFVTEGNLQLSWNDDEGGCIELEFQPSGLEYYFEKTDEEGKSSYSELANLIEKISKIEKTKTAS